MGDSSATRRGLRRYVGEAMWSRLTDHGVVNHFGPHDSLVRQGDPGRSVLLIKSGRVMVVSEFDRPGLLHGVRAAGDLIGELADDETGRTATVSAMEHCTAHRLPRRTFDDLLDRHRAQGSFNDYLIAKLSETVSYQVRLVNLPPIQRVARLLAEIVALADPRQSDALRVPCSQDTLASALGLARSTVAAQVAALRTNRVLTPGPRLVVADVAALHRAAGVTS